MEDVVFIGVMELARRQYADLDNTCRTTVTLLRDHFELPDDEEWRQKLTDIVSDAVYGEEIEVAADRRATILLEAVRYAINQVVEREASKGEPNGN
jgi:hypothetical protein